MSGIRGSKREYHVRQHLEKIHPEAASPTEIGLALGMEYGVASSSVAASLAKLVKEGWAERLTYPVRYRKK